ncbi:MAG: hypothetical protein JWM59_4716 [Verrucomicrobiales bacterium]|nr:hypothetical protein [Verrucomicrobiales bacterium]
MIRRSQGGPRSGDRRGGFTLIEIIIAMTIIAVIAAVAVPTLQGLNDGEKARAPLTALADMVQEVRGRAMREHRQYEIIFERGGIHAVPGNRDFLKRDEFLKWLEELRTPPAITEYERQEPEPGPAVERVEAAQPQGVRPLTSKAGPADNDKDKPADNDKNKDKPRAPEMPWNLTIAMENGTKPGVLFWGDGEWDDLQDGRVRRWVFQPNGMASPVQVRFTTGGTELEGAFDLLTGELVRERSGPAKAFSS